ncbi:DUF1688 family protein, partial [Bradyrhizobium sp. PRIMUS42]|uniref:DUF1688 family protein n=1 Tax=Bradyrhizobium sp. PRIMUS42 TaxID=2908926 RepID=UPI001FF40E86
SLIEPLQRAGFVVTDIDGLTGLAEYRNGGLFVDHGVLSAAKSLATDSTRLKVEVAQFLESVRAA